MKTRNISVDGLSFTIAKLLLDDLRAAEEALSEATAGRLVGEEEMKGKSDFEIVRLVRERSRAVYETPCRAAVKRAGGDPASTGQLDMDGVFDLFGAVMRFSNMVSAGEVVSP